MRDSYEVGIQKMEENVFSPLVCYQSLLSCLFEITFEDSLLVTNEDIKNAAEVILTQNLYIPFSILVRRYILKNQWKQIADSIGRTVHSLQLTMKQFKHYSEAYVLEVYYRRINHNTTDLECYPIEVLPITKAKYCHIERYLSNRCHYTKITHFSLAHIYALIQTAEILQVQNIGEEYADILQGMLARFYRNDIPPNIDILEIQSLFTLPRISPGIRNYDQDPQIISGLGERIQMVIKQSALSNEEVSKYLKVSNDTLVHFIQETEIPSMDTLIRIAKQFNVSISYLLVG